MASMVFLILPDNSEQVVGFGIYKCSGDIRLAFKSRSRMIFATERCLYEGLDYESFVCRLMYGEHI